MMEEKYKAVFFVITITDKYFRLWAIVIPISSFSVFPSIQATTPAYLFALFSIIFVFLLKGEQKQYYFKDLIIFLYVFIGLAAVSQFILSYVNIDFMNANLIQYDDRLTVMFRSTLFTQSLYMLATIATFFYVKHFYNESWKKYIVTGGVLLAAYGVYEILFSLLFSGSGDFISNRVIDGRLASYSDITSIGGFYFARLKSLTAEPSMAALTILPYWIYTLHIKMKKTALLLFITLILTTSGTAVIGIITYFILRLGFFRPKAGYFLWGLPAATLVYLLYSDSILEFLQKNLINKINLDNGSGIARFASFSYNIDFYNSLSIAGKLFGVGFGYIRSDDLFSTMLVNTGIVGVLVLTMLLFYPVFKLRNTEENIGLKLAVIVSYVVMMISVPELYYLPTWLFLGISYHQLRAERALFSLKFNVLIG